MQIGVYIPLKMCTTIRVYYWSVFGRSIQFNNFPILVRFTLLVQGHLYDYECPIAREVIRDISGMEDVDWYWEYA